MSTELNWWLCPSLAGVGLVAFLISGCDRGGAGESDAEVQVTEEASERDTTPPVVPAPCEFVRATRTLTTLNLETEDGACTILLPRDVLPGEFAVSVAVADRTDVASVEIRASESARYYATEGSVTVTEASGGQLRGEFLVADTNPPETGGPWSGVFAVTLE